ncbi:MAG: glycosyl hydrolase family 28-related protein, partial [Cyanobacteria bacterium J06641_5]
MLFGALVFLSAHFGQEGDIQAGCGVRCPEPTELRFDVTDFGATPDNATDEDLFAFQAAIDRAATVSLENNSCAVVSVPPGTYHFQKTVDKYRGGLVLKSNVCLIGEDRDRTIIASMVPMHTIGLHQVDNTSIENLIIDNYSTVTDSVGTHGIRLSHSRNILLQSLSVRNANHYGIGFQGGSFQNITLNDI